MIGFRAHLQCLLKSACSNWKNHDFLIFQVTILSKILRYISHSKGTAHPYPKSKNRYIHNSILKKISEHKSKLIPNSIICTYLDTKPYKSIPEWPDDSQHVFHHLRVWRQGQEESGWFPHKYQQCVCKGEPIIIIIFFFRIFKEKYTHCSVTMQSYKNLKSINLFSSSPSFACSNWHS